MSQPHLAINEVSRVGTRRRGIGFVIVAAVLIALLASAASHFRGASIGSNPNPGEADAGVRATPPADAGTDCAFNGMPGQIGFSHDCLRFNVVGDGSVDLTNITSRSQTTRVVAEPNAFAVDPNLPFEFEYANGSGRYGMKVYRRDESGRIQYFCAVRDSCTEGDGEIDADAANAVILRSIQQTDFRRIAQTYSAEVYDGWQAMLWIRQGAHERVIHFDNAAPRLPLVSALRDLPIRYSRERGPTRAAENALRALYRRSCNGDHECLSFYRTR